ncbi:hypothetical protein [Tamaricihabitans halophyticus]|uniref:hypothetical protein n=1 Tax=Tamaricihabitans halophyticus TaxID=1262583 RepID=UPI001047A1C9|nr:hypothetical protein [Tamaricihabitans halophyticus]
MRRFCARTCAVLGGAIAGTFAAWAISAGSAAAEEQPQVPDAVPQVASAEVTSSANELTANADSATSGRTPTPITTLTVGSVDIATDAVGEIAGHTAREAHRQLGKLAPGQPAEAASPEESTGEPAAEGTPSEPTTAPGGQVRDAVTGTADVVQQPLGRTVSTVERFLYQPDKAPEIIRESAQPNPEPVDYGGELKEAMQDWFGQQATMPDPDAVDWIDETVPAESDALNPIAHPALPDTAKSTEHADKVKKQRAANDAASALDEHSRTDAAFAALHTVTGQDAEHGQSNGDKKPGKPYDPNSSPIALNGPASVSSGQHGDMKPGSLQPGTARQGTLIALAPYTGSHCDLHNAGSQPGTTPD